VKTTLFCGCLLVDVLALITRLIIDWKELPHFYRRTNLFPFFEIFFFNLTYNIYEGLAGLPQNPYFLLISCFPVGHIFPMFLANIFHILVYYGSYYFNV